MERIYVEEKTFDKIDFTEKPLAKGNYENCYFNNCNLSNADLSGIHFSECAFAGCNLSLAKLGGTKFNDIKFKDCKLLGLRFDHCDDFLFSVRFDDCILKLSSFYKRKLKKTVFRNTNLQEADFTEADVSGSVFDNCDLLRATFVNAVLEKADFRTAYNYAIDPEVNRMKKARFSIAGVAGLLGKYDIVIEG